MGYYYFFWALCNIFGLQINFDLLQIDTENSAIGPICPSKLSFNLKVLQLFSRQHNLKVLKLFSRQQNMFKDSAQVFLM